MSDSSAFIAGCATTGAAALILLIARVTVSKSPPIVEDLSALPIEEVAPVPTTSTTAAAPQVEDVLEELEQQQKINQRLEEQITEQDALLKDLEAQIQWQQQEAQALVARVNTHETSINALTSQQQQFAGVQQETDRTQSSLLWVGAGLVVVVLIGGAIVLVILVVLVAFQSRNRQSPASQVVYSTEVPVPPNPYYQGQFLPAPRRTRQVYPQDIYDPE
ncbi:hypothetical protein PN498_19995 [Oscillatoria sp. CS-180]|uniref:hypothetical protein n=1 Tax=Oscillatoria sp. CS-180 TaxID=3021720 RepID=UPI00233158E3|nr:hypothetical protein [Oscillatoria sp. CS-180]MDB9528285.1 hypothetical protein [Oscillatoria sp. CS-180]